MAAMLYREGHDRQVTSAQLRFYFGGVYSPTKRFLIDHPLDPARRHLVHACLEGPENGVYYRGEAELSGGEVRIELPEYFEALTHAEGRTVLLTAKLGSGEVARLAAGEVEGGAFTVRGFDGDAAQAFWWEVKSVRSDLIGPNAILAAGSPVARRS